MLKKGNDVWWPSGRVPDSESRGPGFEGGCLNSLLVTHQMTLFHQGVRMGEKISP